MLRTRTARTKGILPAAAIVAGIVVGLLAVSGLWPRWPFEVLYLAVFTALWLEIVYAVLRKMTLRKRNWFLCWSFVIPFVIVLPLARGALEADPTLWERVFFSLRAVIFSGLLIALIYYFIYYNKPNMRKKIVAGNWKMNTLPAEGVELARQIVASRATVCECVDFIVCPPFTHLSEVAAALKGSNIRLGAQNCAAEAKGAYTGEVAASMIAALGCKYVILGHSERRQYYGETSETLNKKMEQAYANGLTPIYCVGENLEEREAGKHFDVVKAQLEEVIYHLTEEQFRNLVIAYEPVWAIGTGKTASAEQAQEMHASIRQVLAAKFGKAADECPILYGGSCKPSNAAEIFAKEDVDGGLIGGAALKAEDFLAIGRGFEK